MSETATLPPIVATRQLSDFERCGACTRSAWADMFKTLHCDAHDRIVDPVRNACALFRAWGQK